MRRFAPLLVAALFSVRAAAQIVGIQADFTFSPASPRAGETVSFTDTSSGSIYGWYWSFGDGSTSGDQNPAHVYASPGVYSVTLAVLDRSLAQASTTKTVSVAASGAAGADFRFDPVLPAVGQTVQFTDLSSGSPTAWAWEFGDNATSVLRNPTHAFSSAGEFAVKLTITSTAGTSSVTKRVNVQAAGVVAAFAFFPQQPSVGDPVNFQNLSAGSPTSFTWDFGDGASSADSDPTHVYDAAGTYDVTLTVSTASASDSATQTITVIAETGGAFAIHVRDVFELPSETTNGNGHPEPGERIGFHLALSNGTTRTEPDVVVWLLDWTWNARTLVDKVDYGTVPSGAAAALADGRFEVMLDPGWACNDRIGMYLRLFLSGGRVTQEIPFEVPLPNGTNCDPPAVVAPAVTLEEPPAGTSYGIGAPVVLSFTTHSSVETTGARLELSRDGGAAFPELLAPADLSENTGTGPHRFAFAATGPASAHVRFRVTVQLATGGSIQATTSRDVVFANGPGGRATTHLPVVVQGPGRNQTYFTTEATIASPDQPTAVVLTFTPVGGTPVTSPPLAVPKGSLFLPDVFQPLRDEGLVDAGTALVGTLGVTAGGSVAPIVTARVANLPRSGVGTFGLAFGGRAEGQGIADEAWVSGLVTGPAFRSNVSVAHVRGGSGGPITLSIECWDGASGQQVAGSPRQFVLPPDGFAQLNDFEGLTVTPGVVYQFRIRRIAGDDQFRAYGTIIDAVTGDSSYVEGVRPFGDRGAHVVTLASVVEAAGLYGAFFTSDVTIVNRSATSSATVSLHLDAQGSWDARSAFTLGPRQARVLRGVVDWFRQRGGAFSGTVVGPLAVSFSGGDGAVLVRTSSPGSAGGSFGLSFSGRRAEEEAQAAAFLPGARKSGPFRSNLALVNTGTSGAITLSYRVVAAAGGEVFGPASATIAPGGFFQASDVVGTLGAPAGFYDVFVTRTAGTDPWEAYMTILDNVTNDGSFVEMIRR